MTYEIPAGNSPVAYETLTIDDTAGGKPLTASVYSIALSANQAALTSATKALVSIETQPIRWTVRPATTVTDTTNGHYAAALDTIWLGTAAQIAAFRAIRATGSSATIRVTYFI